MASKRRIRKRSCTRKKQYASRTLAVAALINGKKRGLYKDHRTYLCRFCGQYHIGRSKRRKN